MTHTPSVVSISDPPNCTPDPVLWGATLWSPVGGSIPSAFRSYRCLHTQHQQPCILSTSSRAFAIGAGYMPGNLPNALSNAVPAEWVPYCIFSQIKSVNMVWPVPRYICCAWCAGNYESPQDPGRCLYQNGTARGTRRGCSGLPPRRASGIGLPPYLRARVYGDGEE